MQDALHMEPVLHIAVAVRVNILRRKIEWWTKIPNMDMR
jgi:hypothetical protein